MSKYLNSEATGVERKPKRTPHTRPDVKNMYCPRDGHYCEQGDCGNCQAEGVGNEVWQKSE